jgi:hypothetical protein
MNKTVALRTKDSFDPNDRIYTYISIRVITILNSPTSIENKSAQIFAIKEELFYNKGVPFHCILKLNYLARELQSEKGIGEILDRMEG